MNVRMSLRSLLRSPCARPARAPATLARGGVRALAGALTLAPLVSPRIAAAEPTLEIRLAGVAELTQGDPESTTIDARGLIGAGPTLERVGAELDGPVTTMLAIPGGVLVGTSGGGVYRLEGGKLTRVAEAPKLVVGALARHRGELVYATSPAGRIERVDAKAGPLADPSEKYVWSMLSAGDALYVATGEPGRVLELAPDGKQKVLLDPGETHVRTLALHPELGLLVGGGQKGVVYRLDPKAAIDGKPAPAFALYDSTMDEITSIVVDPRSGDVYVAAVSETKAGLVLADKTIGAVATDPADTSSPVKGSEIVRIRASGAVEVLWSSRREGALQLALDAPRGLLLVATGAASKSRGRLYGIDLADRDRVRLLARVEPRVLAGVVPAPEAGAFVLGAGPTGQLWRLGAEPRAASVYVSAEQDAQGSALLGRLWYDAELPAGTSVELEARTGNTKPVDDTWSAWSAPVRDALGGAVRLPEARYVQFRATLRTAKGKSPVLRAIHASIQRRNLPPSVEEIFALRPGVYLRPLPPEEEKEKMVTLSAANVARLRRAGPDDVGDVRARQGIIPGMMTIAWRTEDPNKDALLHRLEVRADGTPEGPDAWRVLADGLEAPFHTFDSRGWVDGRYVFRVTSSDRPGNTPEEALLDTNVSEALLVDNTPPRVTRLEVQPVSKGVIRVVAEASDAASVLGTAYLSIDGGPWTLFPAADRLVDARGERFEVLVRADGRLGDPKLGRGVHAIALRVDDERGNLTTTSSSFTLAD
jgi:hypothetical protein